MTDLEIVGLCAKAMGYSVRQKKWSNGRLMNFLEFDSAGTGNYDPLTDKSQAMDLLIALHMLIMPGTRTPEGRMPWNVEATDRFTGRDHDLLRAICLCAAKIQQSRDELSSPAAGKE